MAFADEVAKNAGDPVGLVRIPASRLAVGAPRIEEIFDPSVAPSRSRIRAIGGLSDVRGEELVAMAHIVRADRGTALRTFNGNLAHENGWQPTWKGDGLQHWEGEAQLEYILLLDTVHEAVRVTTESLRVEFVRDGRPRRYTCDVEIAGPGGRIDVVELKRDERDLEDPEYRLDLAFVGEILRRCDIGFRVVLRPEIFASRLHRRNVESFASRAFRTIDRAAMIRFADFAGSAEATTYGRLAEVLDPVRPIQGRASVQALLVRRLVRIDLTDRIHDDTPVVMTIKENDE